MIIDVLYIFYMGVCVCESTLVTQRYTYRYNLLYAFMRSIFSRFLIKMLLYPIKCYGFNHVDILITKHQNDTTKMKRDGDDNNTNKKE